MAQLECREVTVRFGGNVALDNVSLKVETGLITGLIGPNGAGKTTLFNVMTGLLSPSSGVVTLEGRDISNMLPYRRARLGLARTFQRLELFGALTVHENIAVAASLRRQWAKNSEPIPETASRIIARLGLGHVADVRTDSLPTGQGRLVELGRALAIEPKVLLLDEPASGQDESETLRFAEILHELVEEGLAVLLVEHDMGLVMKVCEHIFVLDFGRLVAAGSPDVVRADPAVQAAYLGTTP